VHEDLKDMNRTGNDEISKTKKFIFKRKWGKGGTAATLCGVM